MKSAKVKTSSSNENFDDARPVLHLLVALDRMRGL